MADDEAGGVPEGALREKLTFAEFSAAKLCGRSLMRETGPRGRRPSPQPKKRKSKSVIAWFYSQKVIRDA